MHRGWKSERQGETTFSHTDEKALVCVAEAPRSCILSSLQTFYHKLYNKWQTQNGRSGQTTVTDCSCDKHTLHHAHSHIMHVTSSCWPQTTFSDLLHKSTVCTAAPIVSLSQASVLFSLCVSTILKNSIKPDLLIAVFS